MKKKTDEDENEEEKKEDNAHHINEEDTAQHVLTTDVEVTAQRTHDEDDDTAQRINKEEDTAQRINKDDDTAHPFNQDLTDYLLLTWICKSPPIASTRSWKTQRNVSTPLSLHTSSSIRSSTLSSSFYRNFFSPTSPHCFLGFPRLLLVFPPLSPSPSPQNTSLLIFFSYSSIPPLLYSLSSSQWCFISISVQSFFSHFSLPPSFTIPSLGLRFSVCLIYLLCHSLSPFSIICSSCLFSFLESVILSFICNFYQPSITRAFFWSFWHQFHLPLSFGFR